MVIKQISRDDDYCFRYGGDEFCSILPNCREEEARELYVQRLNKEIKKHLESITFSVGIVQAGPNEYNEIDDLIREADEKMYAAKKAFKLTFK